MERTIYKISKRLHKYVGLICLLWFGLMGISGVLMNHPELIRSVSVPASLVPEGFYYAKWNGMAMKKVVYSELTPNLVFASGRLGVWRSRDGGRTFSPMNRGYPSSAFGRDAGSLLLTAVNGKEYLYSGTRSGLFLWDFQAEKWNRLNPRDSENFEVKDIIRIREHLLVFTPGECFRLKARENDSPLVAMPLTFDTRSLKTVSMARFLLAIHDGTVLGIAGKLFADVLGLVLIFLTVSALWLWYIPWRRKRFRKGRADTRLYRFFLKYHLKLGIYSLLFLVVITLTGMIIRRPFQQFIMHSRVPSGWTQQASALAMDYPGIRRAVYIEETDTLLLGTRFGFFKGPADFSGPFSLTRIPVRVSGMGANVLEKLSGNRLLVGSFSGLYMWDVASGSVTDASANGSGGVLSSPKKRKNRAVGAAIQQGKLHFWVDYRHGVVPVHLDDAPPVIPEAHGYRSGMSLWRYLRGIHTGHLFRDWLGKYTWIFIPVVSVLMLISLLTGGHDWLWRKGFLRKRTKSDRKS